MAEKFDICKKYVTDSETKEGHGIVSFPRKNHCQSNPTEIIWAQVKTYVSKASIFKMANLILFTSEALNHVTQQTWMHTVQNDEYLLGNGAY